MALAGGHHDWMADRRMTCGLGDVGSVDVVALGVAVGLVVSVVAALLVVFVGK